MDKIDIYNNSSYILHGKQNKYMMIWSLLIFILLVLLLMVSIFYKYDRHLIIQSIVVGDKYNYHLKLLVEDAKIKFLNNILYIDNQRYDYELIEIGDYVYDQNYNKYREVIVSLNINSEKVINNNIFNVTVKLPKTTFCKQFIQQLKEEMR